MSNERVAHLVDLLKQAEEGKLDGLECPDCHNQSVSIWFTQPAEDEYRTWLVCSRCSFRERVHNSARPTHFSLSRIHRELQRRDTEILESALFKRPKAAN